MTAAGNVETKPDALFSVVHGKPDDDEIAALTIVLVALARDHTRAQVPPHRQATWSSNDAYRAPGSWTARDPNGASAPIPNDYQIERPMIPT